MSSSPQSPQIFKAGLVILEPDSGAIDRVIVMQYNPETLSRSFEVATNEGFAEDALRIGAPAGESFTLEAYVDAIDQLETADEDTIRFGILPQLAALESLIYPAVDDLTRAYEESAMGVLEIAPIAGPLVLFVWSRQRVVPVSVTSYSVTEEDFDPTLNPIRARVSLGLKVLSVKEMGFEHKGGKFYLSYQKNKERLAEKVAPHTLSNTGLDELPSI